MSLHHPRRGRLVLAIGAIGASAVVLAGCAGGGGGNATGGNSSAPLIVGTTDKITSIDPAGSYDNGS
ncbi:MAG: peptide ABC transporter substrate-binding protein, partial [Microbacterium sp.]|nr:peptide ABC transporter substrate-binding protein [Microbacterium sp.]